MPPETAAALTLMAATDENPNDQMRTYATLAMPGAAF